MNNSMKLAYEQAMANKIAKESAIAQANAEKAAAEADALAIKQVIDSFKNTTLSKIHKVLKEVARQEKLKEIAAQVKAEAEAEANKQAKKDFIVEAYSFINDELTRSLSAIKCERTKAELDLSNLRIFIKKDLIPVKDEIKKARVASLDQLNKRLEGLTTKSLAANEKFQLTEAKLNSMVIEISTLNGDIEDMVKRAATLKPEERAAYAEKTLTLKELKKEFERFQLVEYKASKHTAERLTVTVKELKERIQELSKRDLDKEWADIRKKLFDAETKYTNLRMKRDDLLHVEHDATMKSAEIKKMLITAEKERESSIKPTRTKLLKAQAAIKDINARIDNIVSDYYKSQWDMVYDNPNDYIITSFKNPELAPEENEAIIRQLRYVVNCPIGFVTKEELEKQNLPGLRGKFEYYKYSELPRILIPQPLFWKRVMPWFKAQQKAEAAIQETIKATKGQDGLDDYLKLKHYIDVEFKEAKNKKLDELEAELKEIRRKQRQEHDTSEELKTRSAEIDKEGTELMHKTVHQTQEYQNFLKYRTDASDASEEVKTLNEAYMALGWRRNGFTLAAPYHVGAPNGTPEQAQEVLRFLMYNGDVFSLGSASAKNLVSTIDEFKSVVSQADRDEWLIEDQVREAAEAKAEKDDPYVRICNKFHSLFVKTGVITGEGRTKQSGKEIEEKLPTMESVILKLAEIAENANGKWNQVDDLGREKEYGYSGRINRSLVQLHDVDKILTDAQLRMAFNYLDDEEFEKKIFNIRSAQGDIDLGVITELSGSWFGLNYIANQPIHYNGFTFGCGLNFMVYYDLKDKIEALRDTNMDAYVEIMLELQKEKGYVSAGSWGNILNRHNLASTLFYDGLKDHDSIKAETKKECLKQLLHNNAVVGTLINSGTAKFDLTKGEHPDAVWGDLLNEAQENIRKAYEQAIKDAEDKLVTETAMAQWRVSAPEKAAIIDDEDDLSSYYVSFNLMDEYGTYEKAVLQARAKDIALKAKVYLAVENYKRNVDFVDELIANTYLTLSGVSSDTAIEEITKHVLVCGGRDFNNQTMLNEKLTELIADIAHTEIIEGGARGADAYAGYWALQNGAQLKEFPANWVRYGKAAGPKRNQQMLDYIAQYKDNAVVVAFWDGESKGTKDMIDRATEAGLEVIICDYVKEEMAVTEE